MCGVFRGEDLLASFRLSTDVDRTADEYAALLLPLLHKAGIELAVTEGVVVCSVVPPLGPCFESLARRYFKQRPLFVKPNDLRSMTIRYDNPSEVGADRLVNALAARELYGAPVLVVDFGTATTFDVVGPSGDYAGGVIAPGLVVSAGALVSHASKLYQVDILRPRELIGRDTAGAMQSGLYYGLRGTGRWDSRAPLGRDRRGPPSRSYRRSGGADCRRLALHRRDQPRADPDWTALDP